MHDPVEGVELVLIGEHNLAQRRAVETAVLVEDILAPALDDILERLRLRLNGLTGELVGVDDGGTTIGQHSGDLRFSAGDISCQSDADHLSLD